MVTEVISGAVLAGACVLGADRVGAAAGGRVRVGTSSTSERRATIETPAICSPGAHRPRAARARPTAPPAASRVISSAAGSNEPGRPVASVVRRRLELAEHERARPSSLGPRGAEVVAAATEAEVGVEVLTGALEPARGARRGRRPCSGRSRRWSLRRWSATPSVDVEAGGVRAAAVSVPSAPVASPAGSVKRAVGRAARPAAAAVAVWPVRRSTAAEHVDQPVAGVERRARGAVGVARVGLVGARAELVRRVDQQVLDSRRASAAGRTARRAACWSTRDVAGDVRRGHRRAGDRVVVRVGGVQAGRADR